MIGRFDFWMSLKYDDRMAGLPWADKDDAFLVRTYKRKRIGDVAAHLSRTVSSVYQRANRLGLNEHRNKLELSKRKSKIRKLLKQGLSDSEVAARVLMGRRALTEMRFRMGIPANGRSERYKRRVAKKTREQCKAAGVRNLAEIRAKRFDEFVVSLGWPGISVRAAQIAEALYRLGPMTRKQICQAVGMPWRGSRKSLSTNSVPGGSYMAELQRAGIVVRLESAITHRGKGNHEDLYMIGLDVEPCKKAQ
jgi:hypothetical protein